MGVGHYNQSKEVGSKITFPFASKLTKDTLNLIEFSNCVKGIKYTVNFFLLLHLKNCFNPLIFSSSFSNKMTRGFNRREPTNTVRIQQYPQVLEIFTRHNSMEFFGKFRGYDDEVAQEFALSLTPHNKLQSSYKN